jgi:hypothetical protein
MVVGMLTSGGAGIALGLAFGAGVGLTVGAAIGSRGGLPSHRSCDVMTPTSLSGESRSSGLALVRNTEKEVRSHD